MNDETIITHIGELIDEEHRLQVEPRATSEASARIKQIAEQLDQCWDLLRQRRARREVGEDPDAARPRDIGTVERYTG